MGRSSTDVIYNVNNKQFYSSVNIYIFSKKTVNIRWMFKSHVWLKNEALDCKLPLHRRIPQRDNIQQLSMCPSWRFRDVVAKHRSDFKSISRNNLEKKKPYSVGGTGFISLICFVLDAVLIWKFLIMFLEHKSTMPYPDWRCVSQPLADEPNINLHWTLSYSLFIQYIFFITQLIIFKWALYTSKW